MISLYPKFYLSYYFFFFFNDTATTEIYTLSLHDALPISAAVVMPRGGELELASSFRLAESLAAVLATGIPVSAESLEGAAADGRVLASPDLSADDRFDREWQRLVAEAGYRALLAVPVQSPRAKGLRPLLLLLRRAR